MHAMDGLIDVPTSALAAATAAAGVALALRGARGELDERTTPLAGLVSTFLFAAQMITFPVAAGTSGHLLGGALAAVLVGPWTAVLCLTVVLVVQSLLFADGGLTALGVNVTTMALVGVAVGYGTHRLLTIALPPTRRSVVTASAAAGLLAVPGAAAAFTLLYWIGGTTPVPIDTLLPAMVGVHLLIGIGEATITAAVVSSVVAVRPDLVHGARHLRRPPTPVPRLPATT